MSVNDREITVLLLCHHFLDIFHIITHMERNQRCLRHKALNRDTLVDQSCRGKCIVWRTDDHRTLFICTLDHFFWNLRILADNHAAYINIQGTHLWLYTVSKNHQIILFNKFLHQFRTGRTDCRFPFGKISVFITGYHLSIQCIHNVTVLCFCFGKDHVIIYFHIRCCNISCGNHTKKFFVS